MKIRQKVRKAVSILLTVAMTATLCPLPSGAATQKEREFIIKQFEELPEETARQKVALGTPIEEVEALLPSKLTVRGWWDTGEEQEEKSVDTEIKKATPSQAEETTATPSDAAGTGDEEDDDSGHKLQTKKIRVAWEASLSYDGDEAGEYDFYPAIEDEDTCVVEDEGILPHITVTVADETGIKDKIDEAAVAEVIALLEALPTPEEYGELLNRKLSSEDEGYPEWVEELNRWNQAHSEAYRAYHTLTEAEQRQVPAELAEKLEKLTQIRQNGMMRLGESNVVKIVETGTEYTSLQEAIANVREGEVITLLTGIDTGSEAIEIGEDRPSFTLDLNGKTLSGTNGVIIHRGNQCLTVTDSSEGKTGKASGINVIFVESTGTLVITGGTIIGEGVGIINESAGTVEVAGGTVSGVGGFGITNISDGIIKIAGGTINGGMYGVYATEDSVIITGTAVIGSGFCAFTYLPTLEGSFIIKGSKEHEDGVGAAAISREEMEAGLYEYKYLSFELFKPVTGITMTSAASVTENTDLNLSAKVTPDEATNKTVTWTVKNANGTGAVITNGTVFRATAAGTATVTAAVQGGAALDSAYTTDFDITVTEEEAKTYSLKVEGSYAAQTGTGSYKKDQTAAIDAGSRSDYRFTGWTSQDGGSFADASSANTIFTMPDHDVTITANWSYIGGRPDEFKPVTGITMANASQIKANTDLTLQAEVTPEDATNRTVTWAVTNANGTGAVLTDGTTFRAPAAGTATITATVRGGASPDSDYTKDFDITVTAEEGGNTGGEGGNTDGEGGNTGGNSGSTGSSSGTVPAPTTTPGDTIQTADGGTVTNSTTTSAAGTTVNTSVKKDAAGHTTGATADVTAQASVSAGQDGHSNVSMGIDAAAVTAAAAAAGTALNINVDLPAEAIAGQFNKPEIQSVNVDVQIPSAVTNNAATPVTGVTLPKEAIEAAKAAGKDLTVTVKDENGHVTSQWTFDGEGLRDFAGQLFDVNLAVTVVPVKNLPEANGDLKAIAAEAAGVAASEAIGLAISFGHSGILPSTARIRIPAGSEAGIKPGDVVYLYYYNPETKQLETLPENQYTVGADGYVTLHLNHCSDYVLLPKKAEYAEPAKQYAGGRVYVVQKGDTVYKLAKAYGCTVGEILAANRIPDVYDLRVGQEIVIPGR